VQLLQSNCTRGLQYQKQSDMILTGSRLLTSFYTEHWWRPWYLTKNQLTERVKWDCGQRCQFQREQRLATAIDRNGQKRRRLVMQRARAGYKSVSIVVRSERCDTKPAGERAGDSMIVDHFEIWILRWAAYVLFLQHLLRFILNKILLLLFVFFRIMIKFLWKM